MLERNATSSKVARSNARHSSKQEIFPNSARGRNIIKMRRTEEKPDRSMKPKERSEKKKKAENKER